ncbi:hypothetical protein [Geofilum rubicundum]|uniref:hypothetical protein n=1 Tax=Geofilum rubicundum TaxID=472113 RepID=UPI000785A7BA|nr:hypothetical protein [Geofilum rubicundum]
MGKWLSIIILIFLMASCHQKNSDQASYAVAEMDEEMVPVSRQSGEEPRPPVEPIENPEVIKKKIIKDGRLGLRVSELEKAKGQIDTMIKDHGAIMPMSVFIIRTMNPLIIFKLEFLP